MFQKVLVANRGEIAARIIEVLNAQDIVSVAVHSEADKNAPHVRLASESYNLGGTSVRESYLNGALIIDIAKRSGATAIHPGYGLLSENSEFARNCTQSGITFIGPSANIIDMMGDKAAARQAAIDAGVPVVPGSDGIIETFEDAQKCADQLGYPVLIKAAGGGGGIGMALVKRPEKLERAFESCRDRGAASFGNPAVYMEKYIQSPRHIEVQILGDQHGHLVHLFERECTIQRRHQKVIEEAPSAYVSSIPGLRDKICGAALNLARNVGYTNAGTVEFIAGSDGHFYFIEMNTRLQVEHPVTEMVTDVDIINWQLRIAHGEALSLKQAEIGLNGHAIECRLYAEDPLKKFIPKPGPLTHFDWRAMDHVRVDSGYHAPTEVTPFYDPMVAKLSASDINREAAITRMSAFLETVNISPLVTNLDLLKKVLEHDDFKGHQVDTQWLEKFAKTLTQ